MGSKGKGGGGDFFPHEERLANFAEIPTSFGHELRACLRCRLVKTYDQFRDSGCENCPFLEMDKDHDDVVNCTTPIFTGIISVMDPSRSWAARWAENWEIYSRMLYTRSVRGASRRISDHLYRKQCAVCAP